MPYSAASQAARRVSETWPYRGVWERVHGAVQTFVAQVQGGVASAGGPAPGVVV